MSQFLLGPPCVEMEILTLSCGRKPWRKSRRATLLVLWSRRTFRKAVFVNNRFPIRQTDKVQPIDNYSSSLINDTVTVSEKPVVHLVDIAKLELISLGAQQHWPSSLIWHRLTKTKAFELRTLDALR